MSGEATDFLYPMIEGDQRDVTSLLDDLIRSADAKGDVSASLTATTLAARASQLERVTGDMADRLAAGGRLFTCGNGGSATDAEGLAALFSRPPPGARPLAARSLVADVSILTALSNDIGFDVVFSRQLIAHARAGDVAMGLGLGTK